MTSQFLPLSVRGAAAMDAGAARQSGAHRLVGHTVVIRADGRQDREVRTEVALLGPGDVVGIDPAQILRRTPRPGDDQMAPNHLATVELTHPDLPWLFSADPQPGEDRIVPWLMLVVVAEGPEAAEGVLSRVAGAPNPVLTVEDGTDLPDPAGAWAWAHVEVHTPDAATARSYLARSGSWPLAQARLVAPRCLRPEQSYLACVVPVFEAGRLAGLEDRPGLGRDIETAGTRYWRRQGRVQLPVYDHWRFRTGPHGDFKHLALLLDRPSRFECGYRSVVVDGHASRLWPGDEDPPFAPHRRPVGTALTQAGPAPSTPVPAALAERLKLLLDRTTAGSGDRPVVGPPLYGRWPAGVISLDGQPGTAGVVVPPAPNPQTWVAELNADPDLRVVAGLGARMVQRHQEALMAEAWAQLADVEEANRRIRWTQLATAAGTQLHRDVAELPLGQALRLAQGVVTDVVPVEAPASPADRLVGGLLAGTNVSDEVLSPAFLHVARYATAASELRPGNGDEPGTGPDADLHIDEAADWVSPAAIVDTTIAALQQGSPEVVPAHFLEPPELDLAQVTELIQQVDVGEDVAAELHAALDELAETPLAVDRIADALVDDVTPQVEDMAWTELRPHEAPEDVVLLADATPVTRARLFAVRRLERAVLAQVAAAAPTGSLVARLRGGTRLPPPAPVPPPAPPAERAPAPPSPPRSLPEMTPVPADLPDVRVLEAEPADVTGVLDPEPSYRALLQETIEVHGDSPNAPQQRSPLHPITATPVFLTPAVELLETIDPEWVLGGLGLLEAPEDPNIVAVLTENHRFVEAFLAGANHEIARELRWRGFPTDMRGSCFRRFWPTFTAHHDEDPPIVVPGSEEVEPPLDDVKPLHTWVDHLGHNREVDPEHLVVVLVKGALLRRYPNTVITVELGSHDEHEFTTRREATKLASGTLAQDVAYLVFDADLSDEPDGNRWYVSLREPTDEPSFGLDTEVANQLTLLTPDDVVAGVPDALRHTSLAAVHRLHRQPFRLLLSARGNLEEGS